MAINPDLLKSVKGAVNKYSRSTGKSIKPKEGRNVWRILAPTADQASWVDPVAQKFWADLGVHWIKTSKGAKPLAVVGSRDICFEEACPVGAAVEAAVTHADQMGFDDDTKEVLREMKVTKSVLFNVINRTDNGDAQEIEIGEVRPSAAQQILDLMVQYADAGQDIFDLAGGLDLVITRSGKGMSTEYSVNVKPGVSKPVKLEALAKCHDLKDYINKEFFKGEENKALNAIQQIAGISVPRLASVGGGSAAIAGASASSLAAAKALGSQPVQNQSPAAAVASAAVPDAMPSDDDLASIVNEVEAQSQPAAAAAPAAEPTPAPAASASLDTSDVDDILSQLTAIGN